MSKQVLVVGLNHRSAPVDIREQVAFEHTALSESLRRLASLGSVEEGMILSTCNRVEIVAASTHGNAAFQEIKGFLLEQEARGSRQALDEHLYTYMGEEAVRHLFRVAGSLDSMVVGEPQILGQLKDFYAAAQEAGTVGAVLHHLLHRSFFVAKRVRSETGIASRPVSVSSVAVDLAKRIFDELEKKTVMVIGAGRMGRLVVRHLMEGGVKSIMITNRTFERAVELSKEYRGSPIRFEDYHRYLKLAEVVIGSTESPQFLLGPESVVEVLKERKQKAMFFIDLGLPRNFDPRINEIDNVYLYHVDDLEEISMENLKGREGQTQMAETMVEAEVAAFLRWLEALGQVPTIVALKEKFEGIRQRELEKSLGTTLRGLSEKEREALEDLTSAMVNKILHSPLVHLRTRPETDSVYVEALRKLFGLEEHEETK